MSNYEQILSEAIRCANDALPLDWTGMRDEMKVKRAIRIFQLLINEYPGLPQAYKGLGEFYMLLAEQESNSILGISFRSRAKENFLQLVSFGMANATVYYNLGAISRDEGDYDKAIEYYKKSMELKPDFETCCNLGVMYYNKCDDQTALEYFQRSLDMMDDKFDPSAALIYRNMANVYHNLEIVEKELECREIANRLQAVAF